MSKTFYITTPIYYPNGEPHLGHAYTTLCADVLARYHRLAGDSTWFLTGTDEHGIKMVKTASEANITPLELADRNVAVFEKLWKELGVTHDDFIRTSSSRHKLAVQEIVRRLQDKGDIYLGSYEGWYDEGQEEFVTETEAKARDYKSAISGRPLVRYKEPTYFFNLKKYVDPVYQAIESDRIRVRPEARKNEILSKLKGWDQDLSISRGSLKWGIQMPSDPEHVLYVWIDALSNYVTALGYASADMLKFEKFWPADVQLIGKEILWFHAFYWPAMLMSLGVELPRLLFAHGWWTSDGKKMSKSMGNFIDLTRLDDVCKKYSDDALRFYMLKAAPFGSDLDWNDNDFLKNFNELANVVGNCLNRTIKMIGKYRQGVIPGAAEPAEIDAPLRELTHRLGASLAGAYDRIALQECASLPVELARAANVFIDQTAPFSLAKDPAKAARLDTVLNFSAQAIYASLVGLLPILPTKAAEGLRQLGADITGKTIPELLAAGLRAGQKVGDGAPLFPKLDERK